MKTKPKIKQSFDKGARNYESNSDIQRLICNQLVNNFFSFDSRPSVISYSMYFFFVPFISMIYFLSILSIFIGLTIALS